MTSFSGGSSSVSIPYFGGGIGSRAKPDDCVGSEREVLVHCQEKQAAAHNLDRIADEHDAALGHGIREGPYERREDHVKENKHKLEHWGEISRRMQPTKRAIATTSSALSASEEKTGPLIMV